MKVKIGTRTGEITEHYFAKFGKNFNKFFKALQIMFPQSNEEIAKDIWQQMGGIEIIEKPILEPSVEVSEQEPTTIQDDVKEVVKTPQKQSKSKAKRYSK